MNGYVYHIIDPMYPDSLDHGYIGVVNESKGVYQQYTEYKKAKEHMADPEKKQKCISAMHKKKKCPHCDFESNAGNVASHIKRSHT